MVDIPINKRAIDCVKNAANLNSSEDGLVALLSVLDNMDDDIGFVTVKEHINVTRAYLNKKLKALNNNE